MPEAPPRRAVWLLDVDGCLVDSLTGTSLRPLAREVLTRLHLAGHIIVVWSAGGATHAERVVTPHGVADLVGAFYDKRERDDAGRWRTAHLAAEHQPDWCVDDRPEETPTGVASIGVSPYLAPDLHDRGWQRVLDALDATSPPAAPELGAPPATTVTLRP